MGAIKVTETAGQKGSIEQVVAKDPELSQNLKLYEAMQSNSAEKKLNAMRYIEVRDNVNYVKNQISKLQDSLNDKTITAEKRAELNKQLADMKKLYQEQQELADVKISDDGKNVSIIPKQDVPVEVLKEKFFIKDGAFREQLKAQALKDAPKGATNFSNGVYIETFPRLFGLSQGTVFNYTRAILYSGESYVIPGTSVQPPY